jgi:Methyltransferase domain
MVERLWRDCIRVLWKLRCKWIGFELTQRYHPIKARRARAISSSAESYCKQLSIWPLLRQSLSTGASLSDYYFLHRYILTRKPKRVLEFGSGCTTLVIADALRQTGGHLYSYEDVPEYHADISALIPVDLKSYVTLVRADKLAITFEPGIWGVRYAGETSEPVEMIFVDGPFETVNGRTGACLDALFYIERHPDCSVDIIVDRKYGSLEAFQSVLPRNMIRYDPIMDLGFSISCSGRQLQRDRLRRPLRIVYGDVWTMLQETRKVHQ